MGHVLCKRFVNNNAFMCMYVCMCVCVRVYVCMCVCVCVCVYGKGKELFRWAKGNISLVPSPRKEVSFEGGVWPGYEAKGNI